MTNTYEKAYTEVLEILKYLPKNEYEKISKDKIEFYEKNKDNNYNFTYNSNLSLNEQNVSREAQAIIVTLFRDYFATQTQQEKLEKILAQNEKSYQEELKNKYNPNDLFKNKKVTNEITEETELAIVEYKESFFIKIKNWFKRLFK